MKTVLSSFSKQLQTKILRTIPTATPVDNFFLCLPINSAYLYCKSEVTLAYICQPSRSLDDQSEKFASSDVVCL